MEIHRKELQDQMSVAKSQEPIRVVSPAAAFQGGAEAPGQENADQTPKSSQLQSLGSGNDGRLPSQFSYPLKRDGQVPAAATQEKPPRARSTPDTRAQSAISVPGDNRAEGPGLEQPRIFGSLNPGRGRSPSLGPNMPPPLPNGDWEFLRADIRGFLAAIVSDNRESLQINFGNLCTTANAHMAETQRQLTAQLVDSLSYFRGEQIKKEEMMTQQLNAFNQGIAALQQSFHALSLAHKDTHTTLQQDYKGLAQKVDMLVSRDQQVTDTLNESLHHHHSQMDALMKSHSNTLLAAFKQPHRVLGDDHKSLEQKLDAVLHSNQHLANQIDALMNSHSATLSATNPAHQSMLEDTHKKLDDKVDTIIMYDRELREHIHTTFQKLPGLRNTSLITQQQSYDLRDDHRKLGEKMSLLFDNDQAMDRSLTEKFEDHNARFEATFESNFNKLIVSHQQACETLEGGQRKLEDKIDAIARDDHGRLATDVVDDLTNQRQTLIKELTAMMDGFSNLETFIHHFCLQMQIALLGNEDSKDLRRRQADQVC